MAKLYTKKTWVDEVLAGDERFDIKTNAGAAIEENVQIELLTTVTTPGTPLNADNLQNIEDGIDAIDTRVDTLEGVVAAAIITKRFMLVLLDNGTSLSVQDGVGEFNFVTPEDIDGYELTGVAAAVGGVSSSGTPTFQIYNVDNAVDMLTTRITIDATEITSYTAVTPPVIDTTNNVVNTGDRLRFDCDVAGTGTKGLIIFLEFSEA